jgi:hypothetical protein
MKILGCWIKTLLDKNLTEPLFPTVATVTEEPLCIFLALKFLTVDPSICSPE